MKQQAAQKKAVQTKARRPTVQTHERQAKDAAARLLNGEQDLNRLLTQTPAAPACRFMTAVHAGTIAR